MRTFGGFSLTWNGEQISSVARYSESQFVNLIQAVLHNREDGVSRTQLIDMLFYDRDVSNVSHSLNVLLYNARKKLKEFGLPADNIIQQRQSVYYWSPEIPVEEDASEFEALIDAAEAAGEPGERLRLYLEACNRYTGEFLPAQAGVLWVAQEARRYRELFAECVEKTAALLRRGGYYARLDELGRYAAMVQPFNSWERLSLEALIVLERHEEAQRLYDRTEQLYLQEMKQAPDPQMQELRKRVQLSTRPSQAFLDSIQADLSGRGKLGPGGYRCSYPVFESVYRMTERFMERGGQSVYLMLCSTDGEDRPEEEDWDGMLESAICDSLRRTDVVCRYGKGQYLVLLVNTTMEDCTIVQQRIDDALGEELTFYITPVRPSDATDDIGRRIREKAGCLV